MKYLKPGVILLKLIYNKKTGQPDLDYQNKYFNQILATKNMNILGTNIIKELKSIIKIDGIDLTSIFDIRWNQKFDDLASGERFIGEGKTMIDRLIGIDNLYESGDISEITVQQFIKEYYAVGQEYETYYIDQLETHRLITQVGMSYKINNSKKQSFTPLHI